LETVRRDFISNISHELRTPLASLKALTETLRDGALEDSKAAARFLGRIETEVDALTQMATELLELSRIESGQVPLELKAVPAAALLLSAVERMRAQAERAGITILIDNAEDMTVLRADPTRLEQVLVNLIHNAIKFTRPGGEVILATENEADFVRFSVRDSGAGIPAEDLERIFERFYKADRARSGGGTGLGLSISRHLVEAHGGRIWAESTEGQGSTFYFTIPRT
jgi:two-component system phosphate regulon sensor histidine kinase PhoR